MQDAVAFQVADGIFEIKDMYSGYTCAPEVGANAMVLVVPGNTPYRTLRLTARTAGATFLGIQTGTPQPAVATTPFDWSCLPPVGD